VATQQPKGFLGWVGLKKEAGQTGAGPAVGTIYSFPTGRAQPRNPNNIGYLSTINAAGAVSVKVAGKKTPTVTIEGVPLKASFFTAQFVNSLIGGSSSYLDTNFNSDRYLIGINNGSTTRYYSGCMCQSIRIYWAAPGGPMMDLQFIAVAGDSENSPGSITTPSTDGGTALGIADVDFNSTVDAVYSGSILIARPQAWQFEADGTLYSDTIQSGQVGGMFTYMTSPLASVVPSTSATVRFKISATPTYVTFALNLSQDETSEDVQAALGVNGRAYTLFNSGLYPFTVS
jgi:hypothetical protein